MTWIADFGLAKSGDDGLTEPGDILGTLRFMAPNGSGARGTAAPTSTRWARPCTRCWRCRPAFESADRLQLIEQIGREEPRRPRAIDPAIPRNLETIVLKAMAKAASARYATAGEMAEDLRRFQAGESILARRAGPAERLWRWGRRNVLAASLAAAVLVTMTVGVVATAISAGREHRMRIQADIARKVAERSVIELREARSEESTFLRAIAADRERLARDAANHRTEDSLDALYAQHAAFQRKTGRKPDAIETALARRALNAGRPDRLLQAACDLADCLPRAEGGTEPGDLDAPEAGRVADLVVETLGQAILAGLRDEGYGLGYMLENHAHFRVIHQHPGFQSLLRTTTWADRHHGNGEALKFTQHQAHIESCALTADGKQALTVGADRTARLWDTAEGTPIFPPFEHPAALRGVAIAARGDLAAVGCNDGAVYLWSLKDGKPAGRLVGHAGPVHGVGWTPDGKKIVSVGADGKVRVWDAEKRTQQFCLEGHGSEIIDLAMIRDGRHAVTAGDDQTVRVWDIEAGRAVNGPLIGHRGRVWSVAAYPDARRTS